MASSGLTFAGDAASIASNPSNPLSWAKLGGDLFGGLFGGGTYATNQGYTFTGTFSQKGLDGNIATQTTAATLPWDYGNASWRDVVDNFNAKYADAFKRVFGSREIAFSVTSPEPKSTSLIDAIGRYLQSQIPQTTQTQGIGKMDNSTIDGSVNPTGESTKTPGTPNAAVKAPESSAMAMPSPIITAALLFVAARYL